MPLVRKPPGSSPQPPQDAASILQALSSPSSDERFAAARAAVPLIGADAALATALQAERDPRVREALLTALARIGTPLAVASLLTLLRSDTAAHRTGALDALRMVPALGTIPSQLLHDPDSDVRLLSCELARSLPAAEANRLLCELLGKERDANVCAAAIDVLAEVGELQALGVLGDCAKRFKDTPFLVFAINAVSDRISIKSTSTRD